jgi:hypothetical protein
MLGAAKQNTAGRSQQSPGAPQAGGYSFLERYVDYNYVDADYVQNTN